MPSAPKRSTAGSPLAIDRSAARRRDPEPLKRLRAALLRVAAELERLASETQEAAREFKKASAGDPPVAIVAGERYSVSKFAGDNALEIGRELRSCARDFRRDAGRDYWAETAKMAALDHAAEERRNRARALVREILELERSSAAGKALETLRAELRALVGSTVPESGRLPGFDLKVAQFVRVPLGDLLGALGTDRVPVVARA